MFARRANDTLTDSTFSNDGSMKFLHAADLHIDSPLRGLDTSLGAPTDRIRSSTRHATEQLVNLAIQEAVDFVIIAGDVFDGPWPDMRTGIWTTHQFSRLENAQIPLFLLRGNHDAQSKVRQAVSWPSNVREFPVDRPDTFVLPKHNVALHGQGFATQSVTEDLAANYPAARPGMFNIGVLHTSLTGDPEHATYAPTTESTLVGKGYDYWALGHVHQRRTVRAQNPCIVFSGNTQGRHIKEIGAKGCLIVETLAGQAPAVSFRETDCLRWAHVEVTLQPHHKLADLYPLAMQQLEQAKVDNDGRYLVARLSLQGACEAHDELLHESTTIHEATAELRSQALQLGDLWLEKIRWKLSPLVDLEKLRQGNDLLGELLRDLQAASRSPSELLKLSEALQPLQQKAPLTLKEAEISFDDPEQLGAWLRQAEGMLVGLLQEGEAS